LSAAELLEEQLFPRASAMTLATSSRSQEGWSS